MSLVDIEDMDEEQLLEALELLENDEYEAFIVETSQGLEITLVLKSDLVDQQPVTMRDVFARGLQKYQKIKADDELITTGSECCICLQAYKVNQFKRTLHKCNHTFHKKCVDKWLWRSEDMSCPVCRVSYSDVLEEFMTDSD